MVTLFENSFITVNYNTEKQWIYAFWIGDLDESSVLTGCHNILEAVKNTGCTKVLNDSRAVTTSWSHSTEWCTSVWFPQLFGTGLEKFAKVQSNHYENRMSGEIVNNYMQNEKFALFDSVEEAKCWLDSHKKKEEEPVPVAKIIAINSDTLFPGF